MAVVLFGLFGLIVGSFLNVVILRFGREGTRRRPAVAQGFGRALQGFGGQVGGRSACPSCGTTLGFLDLVPVFSWLFLRGRCRYCKVRISVQYPLVETSTALLFAGISGAGMRPAPLILGLIIAALLECIFVYDLRHKLIPDLWAWPFVVLALAFSFLYSYPILNTSYSILLLSGPVAALPILFLWYLSKPFTGEAGMWMGFGDVKLALGIGWLLGWPLGFVAIFFAFVIGAVISVCILLPLPHIMKACGIRTNAAGGGYTMKSEVPFGPFLIASCFIVWFLTLYQMPLPIPLPI